MCILNIQLVIKYICLILINSLVNFVSLFDNYMEIIWNLK